MDPGSNPNSSSPPPYRNTKCSATQHSATPSHKCCGDSQATLQTSFANSYEPSTSVPASIEAPTLEAREVRCAALRLQWKGLGHQMVRRETNAQAVNDLSAHHASLQTLTSRAPGMAQLDSSHEPEDAEAAASDSSGMPTQIEPGMKRAKVAHSSSETCDQRQLAPSRYQPTLSRISDEILQPDESSSHDESPAK